MGSFDTKGQIVGLFVGAAGVAVVLILLLTVEVRKRDGLGERSAGGEEGEKGEGKETGEGKEEERGILTEVKAYIRSLYEGQARSRVKRSLEEQQDEEDPSLADGSGSRTSKDSERNEIPEDFSTIEESYDKNELTESLLQKSGNSIRHLGDKVRHLGRSSALVQAVLQQYCVQETYYRTQFVPCNQTNSSDSGEGVGGNKDALSKDKVRVEETEKDGEETEKDGGTGGRTVSHHQPLLEDGSTYSLLPGDYSKLTECTCDYPSHTLLVVSVTSLINLLLFLLLLSSCRLYKYIKRSNKHKDKIWLCEEDDISNLHEDPPASIDGHITLYT